MEADSYAETDNPEILAVRAQYKELLNQYKASIADEADKVRAAGGLFIIGTERHESRRIDNQLRGRAGRQGDPGESRFYLSLQDDLMRLFATDKVMGMMDSLAWTRIPPLTRKFCQVPWKMPRKTWNPGTSGPEKAFLSTTMS